MTITTVEPCLLVSGPHLTKVTADDKVVIVVEVQMVVVALDVEVQVNAIDVVTQGLTFPQYAMINCGTESKCIETSMKILPPVQGMQWTNLHVDDNVEPVAQVTSLEPVPLDVVCSLKKQAVTQVGSMTTK